MIDREKRRAEALKIADSTQRYAEINRIDATYNLEGAVYHRYMELHGKIPTPEVFEGLMQILQKATYDACSDPVTPPSLTQTGLE